MGLLILALGITLNTKTGLGVSPIISVSFSISTIWHFNFGNTTLVLYALFVVVEMILHTIRSLHARQSEGLPLEHANQMNLKLVLFMAILQFPLSLIFTRFLNIFSGMIPDLWTTHPYRDWCRHVSEHAYHPQSRRWNCSGNLRFHPQKRRIYQKLFRPF